MGADEGAGTATGPHPEVVAWVEDVTGGTVERVRRPARWRPNYLVDVRGPAGPLELFLKGPRVPPHLERRSAMLSGYGTRREAAALAALRDTDVVVPRFLGFQPDHRAVLMSRVDGVGVLQSATPPQRRRAMVDYAGQLARTHATDPAACTAVAALDAGRDTAPDRPGPLAAILADHASWESLLGRPDPLVELATGWLADHAPRAADPVLLHGDAGPNQFLHDGGRLTAVIDWELAHLGPAMSDLGYARYREALYPSGAYPDFVTAYLAASGRPLDRELLDRYTVVAALVMLAGISIDVHRPRRRNPEALQRFWWDALSRVALCQVLAETLGAPPPRLTTGEPVAGALGPMAGLLADRIAAHAPEGGDGAATPSLLLARTLQRADGLGLDVQEADETAALLGRRIADPVDRAVAVTEVVRTDRARRLPELVGHFGRLAVRRLDAVSPLAVTDTWDLPAGTPEPTGQAGRAGLLLPPVPPA